MPFFILIVCSNRVEGGIYWRDSFYSLDMLKVGDKIFCNSGYVLPGITT